MTVSTSSPNTNSQGAGIAWLSVKHLRHRFGVHDATIWRWVREGRFPRPVKLAGNITRWSLCDVENWEQVQRRAS